MNRDPIRRDTAAYVLGLVFTAVLGAGVLYMGLNIAAQRSSKAVVPLKPVPYGCYVWSDGHIQCSRRGGSHGAS